MTADVVSAVLASTVIGAVIGAVATSIQARKSREAASAEAEKTRTAELDRLRLDHEHEERMARDLRLLERREVVYAEVLVRLRLIYEWARGVHPFVTFVGEQFPTLDEVGGVNDEMRRLQVTAQLYLSDEMDALLKAWTKDLREFQDAAATVTTLDEHASGTAEEIEREYGVSPVSARRAVDDARRALLADLDALDAQAALEVSGRGDTVRPAAIPREGGSGR